MSSAKNKILSAIILLFGIIGTYVGYDLILEIPNYLNNTLQLMIFWTGLITLWFGIVLITPIYLAISKHEIQIMGLGKAIGIFLGSTFGMVILWGILPDLVTALDNVGLFTMGNTMIGIIWLGAILMFILGCNILPTYCIYESLTTKKVEE